MNYRKDKYTIKKDGNVYSERLKKNLKQSKNSCGYYQVFLLCDDGKYRWFRTHRLVAETFIPNPNNFQEVNHKNERKEDNSVENLEWCDRKYNVNYGLRTAKYRVKKKIKFKEDKEVYQFDTECNLIGIYNSIKEASENTSYGKEGICKCCKGILKTYKNFIWKYVNNKGIKMGL